MWSLSGDQGTTVVTKESDLGSLLQVQSASEEIRSGCMDSPLQTAFCLSLGAAVSLPPYRPPSFLPSISFPISLSKIYDIV